MDPFLRKMQTYNFAHKCIRGVIPRKAMTQVWNLSNSGILIPDRFTESVKVRWVSQKGDDLDQGSANFCL
jgi:hypothetical protein